MNLEFPRAGTERLGGRNALLGWNRGKQGGGRNCAVEHTLHDGAFRELLPASFEPDSHRDIRNKHRGRGDDDQLCRERVGPEFSWPKRHSNCGSTANMYPPPQTVFIYRGFLGSGSSFRRRRVTWLSMLRSNNSASRPLVRSRSGFRVRAIFGRSMSARRRLNSPEESAVATPSPPISSRCPVSRVQSPKRMRSDSGGFCRGGRAWVRPPPPSRRP